jgi:signal transduction histidine kinase
MITPKHHPIKFLLQFEWVMLALTVLIEFARWPIGPPSSPLLALLLVGLFALLGLALPDREPRWKWLHLLASFVLLVVAGFGAKLRLMPLLYVVLVVRTCFMFGAGSRVLITIATYFLALFHQVDRWQHREAARRIAREFQPLWPPMREQIREERAILGAISTTLLLALVLVFLQLMVQAVMSERQSRQQLQHANEQLRRYALRIEDTATLQERNRIAREIHDSLGHSLTAFNLHLEAALRLLHSEPEEARDLLVEAKQLGSNALQSVRESVGTLRSHPLQGKSLETAIQQLAEEFSRSTGIVPTLELSNLTEIPTDQTAALYRIVQEALTNISKYAQATTVKVSLQGVPVRLTIRDDGRGFDPAQTTSGFGLQGMQERAIAIGGTCNIECAIGQGCQITVVI